MEGINFENPNAEFQDNLRIGSFSLVLGLIFIKLIINCVHSRCQKSVMNKSETSEDIVSKITIGETQQFSQKINKKYATPKVEELIKVDEMVVQKDTSFL